MIFRLALAPLLFGTAVALSACGSALPQASSAAEPPGETNRQPSSTPLATAAGPAEPMPELRTGRIEPVVHGGTVTARVTARAVDGPAEVVRLEVPLPSRVALRGAVVSIDVPQGSPAPLAFVTDPGWDSRDSTDLWVRRPKAAANEPIVGKLYTLPPRHGATGGHQISFRALPTATPATSGGTGTQWSLALADVLAARTIEERADPWYPFAENRLRQRSAPATTRQLGPNQRRPTGGADELAVLMETTTGMTSLQETLQLHRPVLVAAAKQPRTIPIATVSGPKLATHPFERMRTRLGRAVPDEPLARATPAEFYYLRFRDLPTLFRLLDELDAWATPAARLLDGRSSERGLAARYEAQLGLGRGPLTRKLGPEVIESVALVGSDPYVREGTDLTAIFRVKSHTLFSAGIASSLAKHEQVRGKLTATSGSHRGVDITVKGSADGSVRQHRARIDDLQIVSNSPAAIRRVLDAIAGRHPRLSAEPDFRYMLTRDAAVADRVLGFAGDRFVAAVIGPRQKVLEARRQLALAELQVPGFAALLFGWLNGRSPADSEELLRSGLLERTELRHGGGESIRWQPGRSARSSWGSPDALTPLIDLPQPTRVTEAEREGYGIFVRGYQQNWSTFVDPILLKLTMDGESAAHGRGAAAGKSLSAHLRILPLIDASEYQDIADLVGRARVSAPPAAGGVRAVLGIGKEAELRRELSRLVSGVVPLGRRLSFDWLGDWAMVGIADRPALANTVLKVADSDLPQRPATAREEEEEENGDLAVVRKTPIYAAVDLGSTAAAALALVAVRKLADSAAPGLVRWGQLEEYRKVSIVQVAITEERRRAGGDDDAEIYYAICQGALFAALQADVLRYLIDQQLDGHGVRAESKATSSQLIVDLAAAQGGAMATALGWLLEGTARDASRRSRASAEIVLRGAPELQRDPAAQRALALATLGRAPLTPDGRPYSFAADGIRDPLRGTLHAPSWPTVPVPGSPTDRLLRSVGRLRSELSFDDEGKTSSGERMRSLRVGVSLGLRHATVP